ncbi:MAG: hypothetical protein PHF60_00315 [Candidatus ainarchaeum sp.]|nr:hypothetical protein [Candidatus ainarchaeum sp.]
MTGTIVLQDSAADAVYSWVWTGGDGEVCLSTDSTYAWGSAVTAGLTFVPDVDTVFGLGSASDNAANTFTTADCDLTLDGITAISDTANVTTAGGWDTCLVKDAGNTTEDNFAFCVNMDSKAAYDDSTANYQVMVPTTPGGIETYYFYAELN